MRRTDSASPAESASPSWVSRSLASLVMTVCRAPRLVLVIALLLCGISIYAALTQLEYLTRRDDLISGNKEHQRRWRNYLGEFGQDEDIVVVVEGTNPQAMREALETLAVKIGQYPKQFDRLFYKVDLHPLQNRALLYPNAEDLAQIEEQLRPMQPLLFFRQAWQQFSLRTLLMQAQQTIQRQRDGHSLDDLDEQFLRNLASILRSAQSTLQNPNAWSSPWQGFGNFERSETDGLKKPQYFFSPNQRLAFLLVRPISQNDSFLGARDQVQILNNLVEQTKNTHPGVDIGLTGLPVLESDEMLSSQQDTQTSSWVALLGVTLLYLLVFRSWRAPFYTISTLIIGALWALGWLTLTVGHLNLLSATFAVMLIGVADYGVLWVTRYQQEHERLNNIEDPTERIRASLRATTFRVGPSILTASLTTGLAFFATMLADFQGVEELGWIAGSGVLLCALSCFTVLPALLMVTGKRFLKASPGVIPFPKDLRAGPGNRNRSRVVVGMGIVATLLLGFFAFRIRYDHNLLHLQSEELSSVRWEKKLLAHVSGAGWHALSIADTREDALARKKQLEKVQGVARVVEVASLIPQDQEVKLERLERIQQQLSRLPSIEEVQLRSPPSLSTLNDQIRTVSATLTETEHPLLTDVQTELERLSERLADLTSEQAEQRLWVFEQKLVRDLAQDLHQLKSMSHPEAITLEDLPTSLRERYVSPNGKWLLRVFSSESLWDFQQLEKFTSAMTSADPEAAGKPFTTLEGLRGMKRAFQKAGIYAIVAIVIVLLLDFRSWRPVMLTLIPLVVGASSALGLLYLAGVGLNPANMIALPLLVGVGVDNGVHVIHDYLDQRKGSTSAYVLSRSTRKGILVAGLTTMLGFGALMLSRHRGLSSMGCLLTLGVGCCMVAALVLLPAFLQMLSRRRSTKSDSQATPQTTHQRFAA